VPTTEIHLPDGRGMGRVVDTSRRKLSLPRFGIELPDSELSAFEDDVPLQIKNQDGRGACNGFASVTAMEYARFVAGMLHVPLSGWFVYAILCNGIDRGSMILDALELTTETGAAPEEFVAYGIINPRKLTDEARQNAPRFRMEIGHALKTWREMVSAAFLRRSMNASLRAGGAFDNLDAEGVPGAIRGAGNHAIMLGGGLKFSQKHGWLIKGRNSWDTRWGLQGCFWMAEKHWANQSYRECYEIVAVHDDPQADNPPVVTN
jgi:hypothetical protein